MRNKEKTKKRLTRSGAKKSCEKEKLKGAKRIKEGRIKEGGIKENYVLDECGLFLSQTGCGAEKNQRRIQAEEKRRVETRYKTDKTSS